MKKEANVKKTKENKEESKTINNFCIVFDSHVIKKHLIIIEILLIACLLKGCF